MGTRDGEEGGSEEEEAKSSANRHMDGQVIRLGGGGTSRTKAAPVCK